MTNPDVRRQERLLIARNAMIAFFKCSDQISDVDLGRIAARVAGRNDAITDENAVKLVSLNYLKHVRANSTPEKRKSRQAKKEKRASKKRLRSKTNGRDELIRHFKCDKYASTIMLGTLVARSLDLPQPVRSHDAFYLVKTRYKEVLTGTRPESNHVDGETPSKDFYKSRQWRELRYLALRNSEGSCGCCGAKSSDGVQIHVDHIKPRSKYPELALDLDNLQILCDDCNVGKSNHFEDDWR